MGDEHSSMARTLYIELCVYIGGLLYIVVKRCNCQWEKYILLPRLEVPFR